MGIRSRALVAAVVTSALIAGGCGRVISELRKPPLGYGAVWFGPDLRGLPDDSTIDEQIAAGKRQVELFRKLDATLDENSELREYVNGIVQKLVAHSERKAPYPIEVHVVSKHDFPILPLPGGQMIVSEKVFGLVTSEAELAAALAHQVAHEIDNDFARFWRMYKAGEPAEGTKEWRAEVEGTEERADELGARMMYAAGWDPNAMVVLLEEMFDRQIEIGTIMEASALTRVSGTRVEKLRALVKQLPRKQGLVETSELFAKFEERFWADGAGAEALRKKQDAATSPESLAFVGEEFDDLPVEPTIEEQVAFAKRRLERLKAREPTLDSNRELVAYFSRIVDRLVEHAPKKPPFELTVHVSSLPTTNAMASLGGAIIVYERFLHAADTEAEIVTVLAHEVAHLVHNDPLATWRSYRESHRARFFYRDQRERRADEDGIRMMHAAGWDPSGVPEYFRRLNLRLRHPPAGGHRLQGMFRSKDRLEELEALIESLPPKPDAVEDSEEFRRLKERR